MKIAFFCCADNAVLDSMTKTISVFNVLGKIELQREQLPGIFQRLAAAMILRREPSDQAIADLRLRVSLNGTSLHEQPLVFSFGDKNTINGVAILHNQIQVSDFGNLLFTIAENDAVMASYEIEIAQKLPDDAAKPQ